MSYTSWSVVFGEQPSAAKWNQLGSNDASFNDGTGIGVGAIGITKLATGTTELGYTSGTPGTNIPNAYTTYATITATSTGGAVRCIGTAAIRDGTSGATRTGHIRVQLDGVTITNSDMVWQTNGTGLRIIIPHMCESTPSAASHSWTFQIEADTATASILDNYQFSVQELR